jgi:alanine racemase
MHRNGIAMNDIDVALREIEKQGLHLVGLMTHFRSSDVLSSELFWQQKNFETVKEKVSHAGYKNIRVHSHNSAAILRSKHFSEDLVRVGIAAYGYDELDKTFDAVILKPVLSLYAKKVSTRVVCKGEQIGYGGDYTASKKMTVSTYDVGYGDGWCRGDAQKPFMTSEKLPILGRVSMDFISLASDKEEVCVMHDAQDAAKQLGTISYEVLTALHKDIKREVI